MTALSLALALALTAPGTPARNARPQGGAAEPDSTLTDAEVADRVDTWLASIDTPVTVGDWRSLGPRAVAPLEAVARSSAERPSRRARALEALSAVGGARARQVVLESARHEGAPFAVRASALHAAGRLLAPGEVVQQLGPILRTAKDPTVRAAAAEVITRSAATSGGCGAVRTQVDRESPDDRGAFGPAMQRCGQVP
jgi:hypothetical protein